MWYLDAFEFATTINSSIILREKSLHILLLQLQVFTIMNKLGFSNPTVQRIDGKLNFNKYHNKPKQKTKSNTPRAIQKRQKRENKYYLNQLTPDNKITKKEAQVVVDPNSNPPKIETVNLLSKTMQVSCYTGKTGKSRNDKVQFDGRIVSTKNGDLLAVEEGRLLRPSPVDCWAPHGDHTQINKTGKKSSVAQQISGPIKFGNDGYENSIAHLLIQWGNTKKREFAYKPEDEVEYYTNGTNRKRKPPVEFETHLAIPNKVSVSSQLKWFSEFESNFREKEKNVLPPDLDSELQRTNDKIKVDKESTDALELSATYECLRMRDDNLQSYRINQLDNALGVEEGSIEDIVSFATTMLSSQQTIKKEEKKEEKKNKKKKEEKKKKKNYFGMCTVSGCRMPCHSRFYKDKDGGKCYQHGNKENKLCLKCKTRMKSMKGGLCRVCHTKEVKDQIAKQGGLCSECKARKVEESTVCFHCM